MHSNWGLTTWTLWKSMCPRLRLGLIDYFCINENLVSLERAMFADYSLKYKMKIFPFFMSISQNWNRCLT